MNPSYFAPRHPDDFNEDFAAIALREEAAECLRLRNICNGSAHDISVKAEVAGKVPPTYTIRKKGGRTPEAAKLDAAICDTLKVGPMMAAEIATVLGVQVRAVSTALQRIKADGLVRHTEVKMRSSGARYRYHLTGKAPAAPTGKPPEALVEVLATMTAPEPERPSAGKNPGLVVDWGGVPVNRLHEVFSVDFETGVLTKLPVGVPNVDARYAGKPVGTVNGKGYVCVTVDGKKIPAHRVIWAMANGRWPLGIVDHKNGVRTDNRLSNLRTGFDNSFNMAMNAKNTSGFPGVSWDAERKKYRAQVGYLGKTLFLGYFDSPEEAADVARRKREALGFDPSHGLNALDRANLHPMSNEAKVRAVSVRRAPWERVAE